jgi:hypothetical protein
VLDGTTGLKEGEFRRNLRYARGEMWIRNDREGEFRYGSGRACDLKRNMSRGACDTESDLLSTFSIISQ